MSPKSKYKQPVTVQPGSVTPGFSREHYNQ